MKCYTFQMSKILLLCKYSQFERVESLSWENVIFQLDITYI